MIVTKAHYYRAVIQLSDRQGKALDTTLIVVKKRAYFYGIDPNNLVA
jgi:hypothetical protein